MPLPKPLKLIMRTAAIGVLPVVLNACSMDAHVKVDEGNEAGRIALALLTGYTVASIVDNVTNGNNGGHHYHGSYAYDDEAEKYIAMRYATTRNGRTEITRYTWAQVKHLDNCDRTSFEGRWGHGRYDGVAHFTCYQDEPQRPRYNYDDRNFDRNRRPATGGGRIRLDMIN